MTDRKLWQPGVSGAITEESLAEYQQGGIRFMEFSYGAAERWAELDFPKNGKMYVERAKKYGVTINSVHLPFYQQGILLDPTDSNPETRRYVLEKQSELIRATGDAGVKIAVIHPSQEPYAETERAARVQACIEMMTKLTAVAKASGVQLALENLPRTCICRVKEEMMQILDAVPDLRVCFDSNHCLLQTNPEYIRAVGNKIITLHISDYDFINERHTLPGDGCNYWNNILTALEESDYNGVFNYEVSRTNPHTGAPISMTEIRENFEQLMQVK